MTTFVLIHGAGDVGWHWHLVEAELRSRGHDSVAPDLPAEHDGGRTGNADPFVCYYHDVPRALAEEALQRERPESSTAGSLPWPLDAWPDVRTAFMLCQDDRLFPAAFFRRLVPERLGITPDDIPGGHCVALSRPKELVDLLVRHAVA